MIHPSYVEMIEKINADQGDHEDAPLITSRYSVVLATAKRARQLVAGQEPFVDPLDKYGNPKKPLSVAVEEIYKDKVHIAAAGNKAAEENTDESVQEELEQAAFEEDGLEAEMADETGDEESSEETKAETEE
ncbi:MAG: DNA-directed RNA polymerase subunit omega [Eubacterium sp.]|nr:DNA-directed RNA polymerase subunit omega [Eubacterium sp.]